jgi:hypothetical protein
MPLMKTISSFGLALFLEDGLHLLQDGVVAAAGTPAHFLVAGVIELGGRDTAVEHFVGGGHCFRNSVRRP